MTYTDKFGKFFGRRVAGGIAILHEDSGAAATKLDANVWPVGSGLGSRYEHPAGIVLTPDDAAKLHGLEIEDDAPAAPCVALRCTPRSALGNLDLARMAERRDSCQQLAQD